MSDHPKPYEDEPPLRAEKLLKRIAELEGALQEIAETNTRPHRMQMIARRALEGKA